MHSRHWPDGLTYLENYISEDDAGKLVQEIDAAPFADVPDNEVWGSLVFVVI